LGDGIAPVKGEEAARIAIDQDLALAGLYWNSTS